MAFRHDNGHGSMFENRYKQPDDNKPLWRGSMTIGGKVWDVAAWEKVAKSGDTFLSMKISDPADRPQRNINQQYPEQSTVQAQLDQQPAVDDLSIPF